ncbi:MAG TPA: branched-chain amino acid ABC transporter permease [Anaerolineaceae bacterium]|nr:branched-chain amino acid ABC transporter permease [Anaerolineaceae bacterium]
MSGFEMIIQQSINGLMLGMMYALVAVGFTLYFGVLDLINFGHGDFFMLGGFMALVMYMLGEVLGLGDNIFMLILMFIGSMLLTAVVAIGTARLAIKPVMKAPMIISLLVTLGLGIAVRESVRLLYPLGANPQFFPTLLPQGDFTIGNVFIRYENLIILAIGILTILVVYYIINRTKMGSAIRAVAQDDEAAKMMGVNFNRTIDMTFLIGAAVAAIAGILFGLYYGRIQFNMGAIMGVIGFSASVIGGLGNVFGAIVGGILFGLMETLAAAALPIGSENKRVFAFLVVILFLIFRPNGILGEKTSERV